MAATSWTFPISGDWATAADWSTDTIPGSGDDATINASGDYAVTVAATAAVHSITLDTAGGTLAVANTLTVGTTLGADVGTLLLASGGVLNGGTVVANGATTTFAGGTLNGVTWRGQLTMSGTDQTVTMAGVDTLTGVGGSGNGALDIDGQNDVLTVGGTLDDTGSLTVNAGLLVVASGGSLAISGAGTNAAEVMGNGAAVLAVTGNFTNSTNFYLDSNNDDGGGSLTIDGTLVNTGNVQFGNGNLGYYGTGETVTLGGLSSPSGAVFGVYGGEKPALLTFLNGGTGFASNSGSVELSDAIVSTLNESFTNSGTQFKLDGYTTLAVTGNFTNSTNFYLDSNNDDGGGSLTIDGTLVNTGNVQFGNGNLGYYGTGETVTLGGLSNSSGAVFGVYGGEKPAILTFLNGGTGFASNSGSVELSDAIVSTLNESFTNSGTQFKLDGYTTLAVTGNFTNSTNFYLDSNNDDGGGSLTIDGTLVNTGNVQFGNGNLGYYGTGETVTLGGLSNSSGAVFGVYGGEKPAILTFLNGGTGFASNSGSVELSDAIVSTLNESFTNSGTQFKLDGYTTLAVTGNFTNSTNFYLDSNNDDGGGSLTIDGTLVNTGNVQFGNGNLGYYGTGETVTLGGLSNSSGAVFGVYGGEKPAILTFLNGGTGFASNSGSVELSDAIVSTLNESFTNSGTQFKLDGYTTLAVTGNFTNSTNFYLDSNNDDGGGSLTIDGTLVNTGNVQFGNGNLGYYGTGETVTLGGLSNSSGAVFGVYGGEKPAILTFLNGGTGFASNSGSVELSDAIVSTLNESFTNSGTQFKLDGYTTLAVTGNFTNSTNFYLDSNNDDGGGSLTIDGTLVNTGNVQFGNGNLGYYGTGETVTLGGLSNSSGAVFGVYGGEKPAIVTVSSQVSNGGTMTVGGAASLAVTNLFTQTAGTTTVQGTLTAASIDIFGGRLVIDTTSFTNQTTLWASTGGVIDASGGGLTNLSTGTLTGGVYEIDSNSTLKFASAASLTADDATIILKGTAAVIESGSTSINAELTSIGTAGILDLVSGGSFNSATGFVDNGQIQLNGGTFAAGGVGIGTTGTIVGAGTVAAIVANSGIVDATGGRLDITGAVSGAGVFTIAAGASLEFDGSVATGVNVTFGGLHSTLLIGSVGNAPTTLASFNNTDGYDPRGSLITDTDGDLLGTTRNGGASGDGTVFEIANTATGYASTPTVLVSFTGNGGGSPGWGPNGSLTTDANGDLIGTTSFGGSSNRGTVFEIAKTATGYASTDTTLVTFSGSNGWEPNGSLTSDANGDLFSTTYAGGAFGGTAPDGASTGDGTVFELTKTAAGYTFMSLVSFNGTDGANPTGSLIVDANGDLFGMTTTGGANGYGTLFEIANTTTGYDTTPITLLSFSGTVSLSGGGASPNNGLLADATGDLFVTTAGGGSNNDGTVEEITNAGFVVSPSTLPATPPAATPTVTALVNFNGGNGAYPAGGLFAETNGDLLGTTDGGGADGYGTVFEIVKTATGYASTPTSLVSFTASNGAYPQGNLIADANGNLVATTSGLSGTANGTAVSDGTVVEIPKTATGYTSPIAFAGTLVAFAAGETIDLLNTTATSATIVGSAIDITLQGGGTLSYATSSALTGLNLATVTDGAGGTDIVAYRIAQASSVTPNPVTFANHHVGDTVTQALSVTNIATADSYSEALDGSVSASSPITATGSLTGLGAGQTNSSSLVVGINTSTSGVKSGTATVSLSSDGTGIDGHGTTPLSSQSVTVTGTVYAYASPAVTASVNFGAVRTTSAAPTQSVLIANGVTANTYQERLRYALLAPSGGFSISSGGAGTVVSGGTNAETLAMAVTTAGTISGTDVVTLTSTGVGTSGLADTGLGTETVALTGTVFATAVPEVSPTNLNFGAVHQGASISQAITITNGNSGVLTDSLLGGFGTITGGYNGSGSLGLGLGSGQSGTLTVTMNTGTVGVDAGSAALALSSHDTVLSDVGVSAGPVSLTGTVYEYAAPILPTTTLNFGAARVGGSALTQSLTIDDGATANAYQESLIYSIAASAPFSVPSGGTGTIVSGGSATPTVALATGTSGNFTGSTITVGLTSTGQGTSGLGNTSLAAESVTLNGKIYATATAEPSTTTLNFGVVHTNTLATEGLTITNGVTGALVDSLLLTGATASGAFGSGGSVVSGGTITQTFTMESGTAGTVSSTGTLDFASYDTDLGSLPLNAGTIALVGTIDNYATAQWEKVSGSGSFTTSGTQATLNFGTVVLDGTAPTVDLGALNAATGLADLMGGSFVATGTTGFTDTGFGSFSTLAAEQADTSPTISLSTSQAGVFTEMVTLSAYGTNASGYYGALNSDTLTVTGTVQAAPGGVSVSGTVPNQPITDQQTIAPFSGVTISDSNVGQTETVTVTLSAAADGSLSSVGGGTYSAGVWSMTGSLAAINAALDELVFTPTPHQVAPGQTVTTTFTIKDTDTAGASASNNNTSVIVTTGTVAPTIIGTKANQTTTGTVAVSPFSGVTIGDLNFGQTETVTVTLSNAANGTLANLGGFQSTGTAGVYTDSNTAAAVTAALDGLIFNPVGTQAAGQNVTTTFTIQDTDTAGARASDNTTSVIDSPNPPNSPFTLTPIYTNGTVELQVWATAGDNAEAADLSITVSPTAGTFGSLTGPNGWLVVPNLETGKALVSEAGASPVGTTTAGLLDTIYFTPAAGATSLSVTATVTDWTDANNVEHGPVTMGPTIVPLDVTLSGLTYSWDNHAILSGVTVSALGSGDPAGTGQSPIDLQDVHVDANGNLVAEVWANAGSGAGNFDATFATASNIAANFKQASTLPSNWLVTQNNTTAGTLKLAGAGLTNLTGEVELGTITWALPAGTTQADVSLTSGDIGSTTAAPLSLAYGVSISATNGSYSVTLLPGDTYNVSASLAAGDVGNAINSADALAALKLAVGLNPNPTINSTQLPVSPYQYIAADVTGDGVVNSADALAILKMAVDLPAAETPTWEFLNEDETFWNPITGTFTVNQSDVPTSFINTDSLSSSGTMDLVGVLTGDVNGSWVPVDSNGNPIANYATMTPSYFEAQSAALGVPLALWGLPTPSGPVTVSASSDNDTLYASPGATLVCDTNTDVLSFLAPADSPVSNPATISGFNPSLGDLIDLSSIAANDLLPGIQAFTFIGTNAFSGAAGELRYYNSGGETIIQGSTAGTGASFQIDLTGSLALQGADFKL